MMRFVPILYYEMLQADIVLHASNLRENLWYEHVLPWILWLSSFAVAMLVVCCGEAGAALSSPLVPSSHPCLTSVQGRKE